MVEKDEGGCLHQRQAGRQLLGLEQKARRNRRKGEVDLGSSVSRRSLRSIIRVTDQSHDLPALERFHLEFVSSSATACSIMSVLLLIVSEIPRPLVALR